MFQKLDPTISTSRTSDRPMSLYARLACGPIAAAMVAGMCVSPALAQSAHSSSGGAMAGGRSTSTPPPGESKVGSGLATYGGAHLVESLDPAFVGWGFDWDETNGEFTYRHPVFTLLTPLGKDSPMVTNGLHLETYVDSQHSFDAYSVDASLSSTIGAVKVSAQLSQLSTSTTAAMGTGLALVDETTWAPKIAPLLDPTIVKFTPEAIAILSIPDQFARNYAWKNYFGRFVAIGYNLEASISMKASANSFSTSHTTDNHFSFSATYGTSTGSLDIGQFAAAALGKQGLVLEWKYSGGTAPTLQLPTGIETFGPSEQQALASTCHASVTGADSAAMTGLFLLPAGSFPGITLTDGLAGDGVLLADVAATTREAMKTYNQAFRWKYPLTKFAFLETRTSPTSGISFGAALDAARATLVLQFDELWADMKLYMKDGNQGVPFYRDALLAEQVDVDTAAQELQSVLSEIEFMVSTLPPMSVELHWTWASLGSGHCFWSWVPLRIVVDNVGIFNDDDSPTSLYNWITYRGKNSQGFVDTATVVLGELVECSQVFYTKYFQTPGGSACMTSPFLLAHDRYPSGPSTGLSRIEFSLFAECIAEGNAALLTITDDLRRFKTISADLDNPVP